MSLFNNRKNQSIKINHIEKCLVDGIEKATEKYPNITRIEVESAMLKILVNINSKKLKESKL